MTKHNPRLSIFRPLNEDERQLAEQRWRARMLAPSNQKPCDIGLFSDDMRQLDLLSNRKDQ